QHPGHHPIPQGHVRDDSLQGSLTSSAQVSACVPVPDRPWPKSNRRLDLSLEGLLTFGSFANVLAAIAYGVMMVSIREHPFARKIVLTHLRPFFRVVDMRSIAAFVLPFILYLLTVAP